MSVTIECKADGPYLVKGLAKVTNSKGEAIATESTVALCRCGGSANKPFCDGTHKRNGFSGARLSDGARDQVVTYRAAGITISDNRSICAHAGYCTDGLPEVFREEGQTWIDPSGADAQAIAAVVARCPSGALNCSIDGGEAVVESGPPRVAIEKDGPYAVRGAVELLSAPWAQGAAKDRYTLCRCGASKNKPFCDGSHWDRGFKDERN
jgi:CDGSH-type Zn-finger protein